jgi:hypothetical protein
MYVEMEHTSYPGYYDSPLSPEGRERMAKVAEVLIPPAEGHPPSGEIVATFVCERANPTERDAIEALLGAFEDLSEAGLTRSLQQLEQADPTQFALLRNFAYAAYYSSRAVVAALQAGGSDYHGAPQPFGYRIDEEAPVPTTPRGSYVPTEEVRRVEL